jgi:ubiquinone/menaquinone biosynthesis C-methylase UbiE
MDPIWTQNPELYLAIQDESRKLVLYPKILQLLKKFEAKSILDYGCGDGTFAMLLDKKKNIALYDISKKMLNIAKRNLDGRMVTFYNNKHQIPKHSFDCVLLSLVLMTIGDRSTLKRVLKDAATAKRADGKLVVTITHPCFRQYFFSTFYTDYAKKKEFNYFSEGQRFTVHLKDLKTNRQVSFKDYHWSLSLTLNSIIEVGLQIVQIEELHDTVATELTYNKDFPPYLIVVCQ